MIGIYCITNKVNGKKYIGQSTNLDARMKSHIYNLRYGKHHNLHLQAAYNKYGEKAFYLTIVEKYEKIDQGSLDDLEKDYILASQSYDLRYGYNMQFGGIAGKPTVESREKISESNRRRAVTIETRVKMASHRKGKTFPNRGYSHSEATRKKIGLKSIGRTWSKESIEKREATKRAKRSGNA